MGAGIAGASAAAFAARTGRKVAILSRDSRSPPWWDWLHPAAATLLNSAGVDLHAVAGGRISTLQFVSADMKRQADCTGFEPPVLVQRDALRNVILSAAT